MKFSRTEHQTHKESWWRFLLLAGFLAAYFIYMSLKFDAATGAWLALLSWSFFVLCTPVADGGFIVAFPVRILLGARMLITQIVVWGIAVLINIAALKFSPESYDNTALTRLLKTILITPWPYWSILLISAAGTGMSIWFGDEMMDVAHHKDRENHHRHGFKHKVILIAGLAVLTVLAYYQLLSSLGISLPET